MWHLKAIKLLTTISMFSSRTLFGMNGFWTHPWHDHVCKYEPVLTLQSWQDCEHLPDTSANAPYIFCLLPTAQSDSIKTVTLAQDIYIKQKQRWWMNKLDYKPHWSNNDNVTISVISKTLQLREKWTNCKWQHKK